MRMNIIKKNMMNMMNKNKKAISLFIFISEIIVKKLVIKKGMFSKKLVLNKKKINYIYITIEYSENLKGGKYFV